MTKDSKRISPQGRCLQPWHVPSPHFHPGIHWPVSLPTFWNSHEILGGSVLLVRTRCLAAKSMQTKQVTQYALQTLRIRSSNFKALQGNYLLTQINECAPFSCLCNTTEQLF